MFKNLLDERDMTCYQLAKKSGVSYTAVNELYRGERMMGDCSVALARKLAAAFQMTLDDFCQKAEERVAIPENLYRCFWDTDPHELRVDKDQMYIIPRLLDKGGYDGFIFMKKAFTYEEMKRVAMRSRNFSPKIASYLRNIYRLKESDMAFYARNVQDWRK